MRIHVPVHLKANFRHLDSVCFALKKKFPGLKRSIKFNDETLDLVADFRPSDNAPWQRLTSQAARLAKQNTAGADQGGPKMISADCISDLLNHVPSATQQNSDQQNPDQDMS